MATYKQINEDGTEVEIEAFSAEEVDQKLKAKEEEFNAKITEKETIATNLANEKKKLEDDMAKMKLDGVKDDHPNFKVLKEALTKKDEEMAGLKNEIATDRKTRQQEALDVEIKKAANGNEEFEKKVRFHLEKTLGALPEATQEERKIKLEAALKLSSDHIGGPGPMDGGIGGGGYGGKGGSGDGGEGTVEFTSREKALGAKLGITAEDYKKYGPRINKK